MVFEKGGFGGNFHNFSRRIVRVHILMEYLDEFHVKLTLLTMYVSDRGFAAQNFLDEMYQRIAGHNSSFARQSLPK